MATIKAKDKRVKKEKTEVDSISSVLFFVDREQYKHFDDSTILRLKKAFNVNIVFDGDKFIISSSNIKQCRKVAYILERLFDIISSGYEYTDEDIVEFINFLTPAPLHTSKYKSFYTTYEKVDISPRTDAQEDLVKSINNKTITVASGSAGCGKTMLSLAMGLKYLQENRFDKMIVIRPISEIGASLGFLPGSYEEKLYNYASPIMEALEMLIGKVKLEAMIKSEKIVFSSVTFLRGANIQNSFVIAEECQNLTIHEITSLLSRLNYNIKMVINGDVSQSDKKGKAKSGLEHCLERLIGIEEIGIVKLSKKDIQRHKLVSEILDAFED